MLATRASTPLNRRTPIRRNRSATSRQSLLFEAFESRLLLSAVMQHYSVLAGPRTIQPDALGAPAGMSPATLRKAYGIDQVTFGNIVGDGAGQTIAIVDAYNAPTVVADLHAFSVAFGLPEANITVVNQTGGVTRPRNDPAGPGNSWALETSLDVQWVHAVAPAAKILLVLANSASSANMLAAVNTARNWVGVSAVSMSWGSDEVSTNKANNKYFTTPVGHTGVTFFASTGDNGAFSPNTSAKAVGFPAASPNVIAVGGTRLTVDASDNYLSESGWGDGDTSGFDGGSGGGISKVQVQPFFQKGSVTQSPIWRGLPDVSFNADPASGVAVYDSWDDPENPWTVVGGTSLSSPLWAGVMALANQGRALSNQPTLDGATQTLPKLYAFSPTDFHDVAAGNNGFASSVGYDLVTGRGSPVVDRLVADFVGITPSAVPAIAALSFNLVGVGVESAASGSPVVITASDVLETSGTATITGVDFYRETNSLLGFQPDDTLVGPGVRTGTSWSIAGGTAGLTPGDYTFYAVATDSDAVTSAPAAATLTLFPPPPGNDNFADAAVVSSTVVHVIATNVSATKELKEPNPAANPGGKSVWWTWTAPANARVFIDTAGSGFDTTLGVYTSFSPKTAFLVAGNNDVSPLDLTSAVSFIATAGRKYYIVVDGSFGAEGTIALNIVQAAPPANNAFIAATLLAPGTSTFAGTNALATREVGEPVIAGTTGGRSVWLKWVAPTSGPVTISLAGSTFDTLLGVYTGTFLSGLSLVASNNNVSGGDTTSQVTFTATAGATYRIAIDGVNGAVGTIALTIL